MKKQLLRGVVVLLSLAFLVVPALAKVSLAPNEKGDMMIYPLYYAMDGIETDFTVINTSNTTCAVAKVVLRSHVYSIEVLDFLIYLTPNDVFKAKIYYENGNAYLDSDDDSLLIGDGLVANGFSGILPKEDFLPFLLTPPNLICTDSLVDDDSEKMGYIEVFEACSYPCADYLLCQKRADGTVLKADLYEQYWTAENETANILTGFAELVLPGWEYLVYKPTVLKDYEQNERLGVGDITILGDGNGGTLCEVEAVLSKNNLVVPYYNSSDSATLAFLNFPTKLMQCPGPNFDELSSPRGAYFNLFTDYAPTYAVQVYDMEEHSPPNVGCYHSPCPEGSVGKFPDEVNIIADWAATNYTEGWTRVVLADGPTQCIAPDDLSYTGAPVIGLILELTTDSEGVTSMALMPPAYDFGGVSCPASQVDGAYQLGFPDCYPSD